MAEDRGLEISGTAVAFLAFSWITTILRIYCRVVVIKSFGSDDWLALFASIFFTIYCSFSIEGVNYGSGKPTTEIPLQDIPTGMKYWWLCEPFYIISALLIKLSIGVFLLRICIAQMQKTIIYIIEVVMVAMSLGYFFVFIFQCRPSAFFWTRLLGATNGSCLDTSTVVSVGYAYSSVSCVADWTLGLLPVFMVWNLQMELKTKLSVAMILALGAIASTATIVRIPYISGMSNVDNFLYTTTDVAIWSTVEVGVGISASAIATLRPLFKRFLEATSLSSSGRLTGHWPTGASRAGYLRNTGQEGIGLDLRADGNQTGTVTTTIGAGSAGEEEDELPQNGAPSGKRKKGKKWDVGPGGSRPSTDDSSEDADFSKGIRKTMVVRTNREIV